jgi:hypothetical protein
MSPRKKLKIPIQGGGMTSLAHAERYQRRGVARIVNGVLVFFGDPKIHRRASVDRSKEIGYDRAAHSGLATLQAIRNIPVAGPIERLLTEPSKRRAA